MTVRRWLAAAVLLSVAASCAAALGPIGKVARSVADKSLAPWLENGCGRVRSLLRRKQMAVRALARIVKKLGDGKRLYEMAMFRVLLKELDEAEQMAGESFVWLDGVLHGDYKDVVSLQRSSLVRLEALRGATLKEEKEYKDIVRAHGHLSQLNESHMETTGLIGDILKQVAKAADQLEMDLDDHPFDKAIHNLVGPAKGANIETVIRLDDAKSTKINKTSVGADSDILKLVDAHDNQYVLAKGKDSTVPHEDYHLIQDILLLLLSSFLLCWLCTLLTIPSMFGYIVCGILLGPSGFNILKSLVQIETLGEFGVFFILFVVGLEFSPDKISQVLRLAVCGTLLMMSVTVAVGVGIGVLLHVSVAESGFIAACLSLSSTPLVVKFLNPYAKANSQGPSGTEYGTVLMGILIMQDVLLGLLMAALPTLAASSSGTPPASHQRSMLITYVVFALKRFAAIGVAVSASWVVSRYVVGRFFRHILQKSVAELTVLATVMLMFVTLLLTDMLSISMELGCFLAGVLISAQGQKLAEQIEKLIQPIKDFLSCFFFASIGLHVFPQFLLYELTILTTFTMAIVCTKYIVCVLVLKLLMRHSAGSDVKWIVAAGLAQVSEFSFVLSSRARRLSLISREVYLLILSVTTLSLLFAPVLWKATIWYMHLPTSHSRHSSCPQEIDLQEDGCSFDQAIIFKTSQVLHTRRAKRTVSQ